MTGAWVGKVWIPPYPWKLYNLVELQTVFAGRRMLWIGDSTARRSSMVLFSILNETTNDSNSNTNKDISDHQLEQSIDVNRREKTENCTNRSWASAHPGISICRHVSTGMPMTSTATDVTLYPAACVQQIKSFFRSENDALSTNQNSNSTWVPLSPHFDVVIISLGIWHEIRPRDCRLEPGRTLSAEVSDIVESMQQLLKLQPHLRIVWRTSGWGDHKKVERQSAVHSLNEAIRTSILKQQQRQGGVNATSVPGISFVDWGSVVAARSNDRDRIQGDIKAHYGLEARLALIQMLANHFVATTAVN